MLLKDSITLNKKDIFHISGGSIELLKWIGILTMTIDHINTFYFNSEYELMRQIGRIALPVFVIVLSYNIANFEGDKIKKIRQVIRKLFYFGVAAIPAFAYFKYVNTLENGHFFLLSFYELVYWLLPLNVMFTFIALMFLLVCCEKAIKNPLTYTVVYCFVLIAVAGIGEYGISALFIGTGVFVFYIKPGDKQNAVALKIISIAFFVVGYLILVKFTSNSLWTLIALPVIYMASKYVFKAPRASYFFYAYYPIHISLIVLLATATGSY